MGGFVLGLGGDSAREQGDSSIVLFVFRINFAESDEGGGELGRELNGSFEMRLSLSVAALNLVYLAELKFGGAVFGADLKLNPELFGGLVERFGIVVLQK